MASGRNGQASVVVDAVLGAASGFVASWVMEKAQARIARAGGEATKARERRAQGGLEPATVRAAERGAELLGKRLPDDRKGIASEAVHYATGTLFGAAFGVLACRLGVPALLGGIAYGAAVWLVNDETLVPSLGWSRPPWAYPASTHAKALASHVVYGAATGAGFGLLHAAVH